MPEKVPSTAPHPDTGGQGAQKKRASWFVSPHSGRAIVRGTGTCDVSRYLMDVNAGLTRTITSDKSDKQFSACARSAGCRPPEGSNLARASLESKIALALPKNESVILPRIFSSWVSVVRFVYVPGHSPPSDIWIPICATKQTQVHESKGLVASTCVFCPYVAKNFCDLCW